MDDIDKIYIKLRLYFVWCFATLFTVILFFIGLRCDYLVISEKTMFFYVLIGLIGGILSHKAVVKNIESDPICRCELFTYHILCWPVYILFGVVFFYIIFIPKVLNKWAV